MTRDEAINRLMSIAEAEEGYLEKKDGRMLDSKEGNAGHRNFTKYARDLYPALQGNPWCDMLCDWCFVQAFGREVAMEMVGGAFSAYTPTSAAFYKSAGRWFDSGQRGDQIFFRNNKRICHTGLVRSVSGGKVYTVEGNTSSSDGVVPNGGAVRFKVYDTTDWRIAGYGRPDWDLVITRDIFQEGFKRSADGLRWWYQYSDGSYAKSGWKWLTEATTGTSGWYLFDDEGYMLTGHQRVGDEEFYICEEPGVNEGKCMITDGRGVLRIPAEYDFKNHLYK